MSKSSLFVSMVVAISLAFTASCVSKEVEVTETYYETEYRTEEYTDTENVARVVEGEDQLAPEVYWWTDQIYFQTDPTEKRYASKSYLCYFGYKLPKYRTARISVYTWTKPVYIQAYDFSDIYHIDSPHDVLTVGSGAAIAVQSMPHWPWWDPPEGWKPPQPRPFAALNSYVAFLNSMR